MDVITERCGEITLTVSDRVLSDGRPVLLFTVSGEVTSAAFAHCLERVAGHGVLSPRCRAILDIAASTRRTDVDGLFHQADVLARARVKHLSVCYLSDTEATAALVPLVAEVFQRAGVRTDIHICQTLDDALAWMETLP
ncbi:hypothetical protein [Roseospira goensis]|uniref:STAS/SEC14 domain-containing protein n=1 Tax=Roseospira goensis TaxID=391922 RepID=A0A7W6WJ82_9PROT|nr:hypothetical protein [Roseospira goensis]MBB4284429.1 hypothetical protein [Roseospira goensis]